MRIYVSGPMSGVPKKDYTKAFAAAAKKLRKAGHQVVNPVELDKKTPKLSTWSEFMRRDIKTLMDCDGIHMLEGWESSEGAKLELLVAKAVGVFRVDSLGVAVPPTASVDRHESILVEADKLVNGPRQDDYGHPLEDFTRTGKIWGVVLDKCPHCKKLYGDVPPEKVGLCMVGVKMSREVNRPKTDGRRDGAGYFGTVDLVMEALGRKDNS